MASTKRKSAHEAEIGASKKRHKTGFSARQDIKSFLGGKAVAIEHLAWKEVSLPDRLEDAEGFFGLEEVEDIQIVRDPQSGNVVYKVSKGLRNQFFYHAHYLSS